MRAKSLGAFLLVFSLLLHFSPQAAAQVIRLTESEALDRIEASISAGDTAQAAAMLDQLDFETESGQVQAAFFRALVLREQGRTGEAAAILRNILAQYPSLARVRLELALTLQMSGESESARHHYDLLLGEDIDPFVERQIRGVIDQIDDDRRWTFSVTAAIAPSTNINSATAQDYVDLGNIRFDLDDDAQARTGIGAVYGFDAGYALPLGERWSLVSGATLTVRDYSGRNFDDVFTRFRIGPRYRFESGYAGIEAVAGRRWFGGRTYNDEYGLAAYARFVPGRQFRVSVDGEHLWRRYPRGAHMDGTLSDINFAGDYLLGAARFARLIAGYTRVNADADSVSYHEGRIGAGFYTEMPWGLSAYAEAVYARREYDAPALLFGPEARTDDRIRASLSLTKRDWNLQGFAPRVTYAYTRNFSNIDFNEYDKHDVMFSLTKDF